MWVTASPPHHNFSHVAARQQSNVSAHIDCTTLWAVSLQDGKCARLGCCVCGCPALLIVRGELQPRQPAAHPHGHCVTIIQPHPMTATTNSSSSSSLATAAEAAANMAAPGTGSEAGQQQQQQLMETEVEVEAVPPLAPSTHPRPLSMQGGLKSCERDIRTTLSIISRVSTVIVTIAIVTNQLQACLTALPSVTAVTLHHCQLLRLLLLLNDCSNL